MTHHVTAGRIVQGILLTFALVVHPDAAASSASCGAWAWASASASKARRRTTARKARRPWVALLIILVVGGVSIVVSSCRAATSSTARPSRRSPTLALVGVLGTADDWLNARTGDGIRGRQKMLWQTVVALVAAWQIQQTYDDHGRHGALRGPVGDRPLAVRPLRGLRDRRHQQRREHHRRARRPVAAAR